MQNEFLSHLWEGIEESINSGTASTCEGSGKGLSIWTSRMYGIPKSTLRDYVTGKVQFGARPGPTPYLSHGEEEELGGFLVQVARIGYPRNKWEVLALLQQIVESKGIETVVTNGWWERFYWNDIESGQPILYHSLVQWQWTNMCWTDILTCLRIVFAVIRYLTHLLESLSDETGLPLTPKSEKVVGSKNPSFMTGSSKTDYSFSMHKCGQVHHPPFCHFKKEITESRADNRWGSRNSLRFV